MKLSFIILFIYQIFTLHAQDNSTAKKIFDESFIASQKISACSYDATWKILPMGQKDTVVQKSHVQINFNSKKPLGIDSFYCAYLSFRISYNGKTFIWVDTAANTVEKITDTQKIHKQIYAAPLSLFVLHYLNASTSPTQYMVAAFDTICKTTIDNGEFVGGELCNKVTVEYTYAEAGKNEFYIGSTSKLLLKSTAESSYPKSGGARQYYSVEINNLKIEPQQFDSQYSKDIILEERIPKASAVNSPAGFSPGQRLPAIEIKTIDNQFFDFSKNKDTVYLLYSWFIGCGGCEMSRPMMKEFDEKYSSNHPFKIIGLNFANKDEKVVRKFLEQKGIKYQNAIIDKKDKELLRLEAPTFIVVKSNTILYYQMGYKPSVKEMLERAIIPNF